MPRLDDGQLQASASKFKKRRAWLLEDDSESLLAAEEKAQDSTVILPASSHQVVTSRKALNKRVDVDNTRLEQDQNMTGTRPEHDWNMSETRVEQEIPHQNNVSSDDQIRLKQDRNKSGTRLEQEWNKSGTNLEHNQDKNETNFNSFFAFILHHKQQIAAFDDGDDSWLILSLSDVQKRMFWHVAINCIDRGAPKTGPIEIKGFFSPLRLSTDVVRVSLRRLVEKGLLQREKGKLGRNGFAIISLPRPIHEAAKELFANFGQSVRFSPREST